MRFQSRDGSLVIGKRATGRYSSTMERRLGVHRHSHPHCDWFRLYRESETGRHHPDYRERKAVKRQHASRRVRIGPEMIAPKVMAQDDGTPGGTSSSLIFFRQET